MDENDTIEKQMTTLKSKNDVLEFKLQDAYTVFEEKIKNLLQNSSNKDKNVEEGHISITDGIRVLSTDREMIKDFIIKEMSHLSDRENNDNLSHILADTSTFEQLERVKSENEALRQQMDRNSKEKKKLKKKVSKLKERVRQNEEYMEMLRDEMVEIHKENKLLSSRKGINSREGFTETGGTSMMNSCEMKIKDYD